MQVRVQHDGKQSSLSVVVDIFDAGGVSQHHPQTVQKDASARAAQRMLAKDVTRMVHGSMKLLAFLFS